MVVRRTKRSIKPKKLDIQQALMSMEGRLDAKMDKLVLKIDDTAQSFKEYVDIKISLVQNQMDQRFEQVDKRFDKIEKKLDVNTAGVVDLIETRIGEIIKLDETVEDHEKRIGVIEEKIS